MSHVVQALLVSVLWHRLQEVTGILLHPEIPNRTQDLTGILKKSGPTGILLHPEDGGYDVGEKSKFCSNKGISNSVLYLRTHLFLCFSYPLIQFRECELKCAHEPSCIG